MHRYALSFPNALATEPAWQRACAAARLRRIEFSCDTNVLEQPEAFDAQVRSLALMQTRGEVLVGSIHIPFGNGWDFASPDEAKRRQAVRRVERFLRACRPLTCRNYTLHGCLEPVPLDDEPRQRCIEAFRQTLADLMPLCRELDVSLNVEILPRSCLANHAAELQRMTDGFPLAHVGVCFDVNRLCGHPEALPDSIRLLAPRIRAFHLSDYDGIDECHWYPMLGVIDWPAVMEAIRELPQDVILIFETHGFIHPPAWQQRTIDPACEFRNAERLVFLLENAAEITARIAETPIA